MPTYKAKPFDAANVASKLPEPMRAPAGAALQALVDLFGGDNPVDAIAPSPLIVGAGTLSAPARALIKQLREFRLGATAPDALETFSQERLHRKLHAPPEFVQPSKKFPIDSKVTMESAFPQSAREAGLKQEGYGQFGMHPESAERYAQQRDYYHKTKPKSTRNLENSTKRDQLTKPYAITSLSDLALF